MLALKLVIYFCDLPPASEAFFGFARSRTTTTSGVAFLAEHDAALLLRVVPSEQVRCVRKHFAWSALSSFHQHTAAAINNNNTLSSLAGAAAQIAPVENSHKLHFSFNATCVLLNFAMAAVNWLANEQASGMASAHVVIPFTQQQLRHVTTVLVVARFLHQLLADAFAAAVVDCHSWTSALALVHSESFGCDGLLASDGVASADNFLWRRAVRLCVGGDCSPAPDAATVMLWLPAKLIRSQRVGIRIAALLQC